MIIDQQITVADVAPALKRFWKLSGEKILSIQQNFDQSLGAPVITSQGKYTARGWTEWTQGFQFGSAILQYEARGEDIFLRMGRDSTRDKMSTHLTHTGVHDHGFHNISTYGNLLRLMEEGKIPANDWEGNYYRLALKASSAVQASRWTQIPQGGFIHSFNGPHSLFVDTIRSCRILMVGHLLGHVLMGENDQKISLLKRAVQHLLATARYSVYYGENRDLYDVWGRTAHESIFNIRDGNFRCPNSQQGYSGFTTWTRGLSWAMCGFAEELEFVDKLEEAQLEDIIPKAELIKILIRSAKATCDYYLANTPSDGIPYWDSGAPSLGHLGDYLNKPADPFNDFEPVDSSAATIAAQGLLRLGNYLKNGQDPQGNVYWQAGLNIVKTLLSDTYLSHQTDHQGLILHSIYHRPKGWDHIPQGSKIPCGESSMWGDYHARELAIYLERFINGEPYYAYFNCLGELIER